MPFKRYGIHSNEVLDRYFYYNPKDFIWMCRSTDTPACEAAAAEIEQQLECEKDLDFRGMLSDKIDYAKGHWVPLEGTNGREEEKYKWASSATHVDEGTKRCQEYTSEDCPPEPFTQHPPHPVKDYRERMNAPPILVWPTTEQVLGQHQNPTPWITCGLYKGTQRF